jgi:hypothetical protein
MISEHTTVESKLSSSVLCQISSSQPTYIFHRQMSYDRLYWSRFHAQVTRISYLCLHLELELQSEGQNYPDSTLPPPLCILFTWIPHTIFPHISLKQYVLTNWKKVSSSSVSHNLIIKILKAVFLLPQSLHTSLLLHIRFHPPQISIVCGQLYRYNTCLRPAIW